jgi:hypothetical protein
VKLNKGDRHATRALARLAEPAKAMAVGGAWRGELSRAGGAGGCDVNVTVGC